jgi:hypothetical protein
MKPEKQCGNARIEYRAPNRCWRNRVFGLSHCTRLLFLAVLVLSPLQSTHAAGDGPRIHGFKPIGLNGLVFNFTTLADANRSFDPSLVSPIATFDTNIINILYFRTHKVSKFNIAFLAMLRGGDTTLKTFEPLFSASSSGLADPFIGATINLFGSPPMAFDEFKEFKPGLKMDFLAGAMVPLGEWDKEKPINLGANRWTFRLGTPIVYSYSGIGGRKASLELVPNLLLFTENKDRNLEQDALFMAEGHITQDFSPRAWGSLGFTYFRGGKTKVNGEVQNGSQKSLGLTATFAFHPTPAWSLQFRYGQTVAQNEFGMEGDLYQIKVARFF